MNTRDPIISGRNKVVFPVKLDRTIESKNPLVEIARRDSGWMSPERI